MARGKFATRSEARSALTSSVTELEAGRLKIRALLAENDSLRQQLVETKSAHAERLRVLNSQIDEGTSDALEAARRQIQGERERAASYKRDYRDSQALLRQQMRNAALLLSEGLGKPTAEILSVLSGDREGARAYLREATKRDLSLRSAEGQAAPRP